MSLRDKAAQVLEAELFSAYGAAQELMAQGSEPIAAWVTMPMLGSMRSARHDMNTAAPAGNRQALQQLICDQGGMHNGITIACGRLARIRPLVHYYRLYR